MDAVVLPNAKQLLSLKQRPFQEWGSNQVVLSFALRCHPHHWSQRVQKCPSRPPRDSSLSCGAAATLEPSDCKKKGRLQVQWASFPLRTPPKMYFQQKQASLPGLGSYQTPAKTPLRGLWLGAPAQVTVPRAGLGLAVTLLRFWCSQLLWGCWGCARMPPRAAT